METFINHKQINEDLIFHFLLKVLLLILAALMLIHLTDHGVSSTDSFLNTD